MSQLLLLLLLYFFACHLNFINSTFRKRRQDQSSFIATNLTVSKPNTTNSYNPLISIYFRFIFFGSSSWVCHPQKPITCKYFCHFWNKATTSFWDLTKSIINWNSFPAFNSATTFVIVFISLRKGSKSSGIFKINISFGP